MVVDPATNDKICGSPGDILRYILCLHLTCIHIICIYMELQQIIDKNCGAVTVSILLIFYMINHYKKSEF